MASKAIAAQKAARGKAEKEAARKAKRKAAEKAQLRAAVLGRFSAVDSSDGRYEVCLRMVDARVTDPDTYCRDLESEFTDTPEGGALYRAEQARAQEDAAEAQVAAKRVMEAELAKKQVDEEADQLKRVRACCRGLKECVETNGAGLCRADRALLETACGSRQFARGSEIASICHTPDSCMTDAAH